MANAQSGIFTEGSRHAYFLEYQLDLTQPVSAFKQALKQIYQALPPQVECVCAFSATAWQYLQPNWRPAALQDFTTLTGPEGLTMPSSQRDVFFWIHSAQSDLNFDVVLQIQAAMTGIATVQLDLPSFMYHDSRDLTGFIDGTANPKEDKRQLAALIPEGELGAAGSYVLSQQWVHKLAQFHQLPVTAQEQVIGRTKADSIELEGDAMPANSHVSRTDVKVDGKAMKIYRRSVPYGNSQQQGLYFLGFACERERFDIQLQRMVGAAPDGISDHLMQYSTPITGSYWFAPSQDDLTELMQ